MCSLCVLCCVCGVLGHLAPVHWSARSVCCFACAVSWATWFLFTGVPARCVVLRVPCPRPLGPCSPVCTLCPLLCLCGLLGHLTPVHRCARSVCCVAGAVSWATWLLFTGVRAPSFAFLVRCPGPLGCCSPMCRLAVLCCVCGVLGHFAFVHRCAPSVRCFVCAVSWAIWFLITGVPARCVVLGVRCPGPLGSCSPVCSLGVLGCELRVRCCMCGAHTQSIWTAAVCSRQGLGTLRARTRPSGRRLFVAGRGWVPSGRALVHPDGGCFVAGRGWVRCRARSCPSGRRLFVACRGWVPSGRALVHPDGCWCCLAPVLVPGFRCVLCALSGFAAPGGRCCLAPVSVPWLWPAACLSGVPRWPARCAAPRLVLSLSVLWLAFPTPWCLSPPRGLAPPALLGGFAGHAEAGLSTGLIVPAAGPRQGCWARSAWYLFGFPRWHCPCRVPPALVLGCVRCGGWRVWTRSLTAPGLLRVDADTCPCRSEDARPVSRAFVRVLVFSGRVGLAGLRGAFWCASPFCLAALLFCFDRPLPGWVCPTPLPLFASFFFVALFPL